MALLEVNRHRGMDAGVSQWVFDGSAGRISARDHYGNLVMALAAGPLFGPRLAAAFGGPAGSGSVHADASTRPPAPAIESLSGTRNSPTCIAALTV